MGGSEESVAGTILYIDDQPELPQGCAEALSGLGFHLKHTQDPQEGLRWAREGLSRLVLLEVLLESGDGWELLTELGSCTGSAGELPVLILTRGPRTPDLYSRAVEAGAADFLTKPVLRAELIEALLETVERSEAERPIDADCGGPGDVPAAFSGDLADVPLAEMLVRLRRLGASGILWLQSGGETHGIQLRNGSPVAAATHRDVDSLEDFLVRTKEISGAQHGKVKAAAAKGGRDSSEILLELGLLSEQGIQDALARRAAAPLLEGFEWRSGSFRFEESKRLPSKKALEFRENAGQLLLEGCLRWMPSRRIRQLLDQRAGHYVSKEDRPLYTLSDLGSLPCAPERLEELEGDRTVAEVLEEGLLGERLLYGLLVVGLVEVYPEPVVDLSLESVPGVEPTESVESVDSVHSVDSVDLAESAESAESVELATQPIAPPAIANQPVAAAPEQVSEDLPKDERSDKAASRRLDAERWFRDGTQALAAKRTDLAVEAFGTAAHLDPSQGEYHAHLGYALHLRHPDNSVVTREALEHIAKGVKLEPGSWKPLVFLGRVFRASGDLASARKVIGRALRMHPDCASARAERRLLLETGEHETTGITNRVRGWFGGGR
jgi:CheY-like chemotaxis protein/tetratricopeptide (TPR) repeat protein